MSATFYALHSGSGEDDVCQNCLPEARREKTQDGGKVSVAQLYNPSSDVYCSWCFAEASS